MSPLRHRRHIRDRTARGRRTSPLHGNGEMSLLALSHERVESDATHGYQPTPNLSPTQSHGSTIDRTADCKARLTRDLCSEIQRSILIVPLPRSLSLSAVKIPQFADDPQIAWNARNFTENWTVDARRGNKAECYWFSMIERQDRTYQYFCVMSNFIDRDFSWRSSVIDTRHGPR